MDKGLFGWIYLLNPCGCPPISDDDPKECQQLISQRAGKSHYTSHNLHVLKEPFQTLHFTSCLKRFFSPSHLHYPTNTLDISALEMSALTKLKRDFLRIVLVGRAYARLYTHRATCECLRVPVFPIHSTKFQPCWIYIKFTPNLSIVFFFLVT